MFGVGTVAYRGESIRRQTADADELHLGNYQYRMAPAWKGRIIQVLFSESTSDGNIGSGDQRETKDGESRDWVNHADDRKNLVPKLSSN